MAECKECYGKNGTLFDALESVIWYSGHYKWLKELRDILEKLPEGETYTCPFDTKDWHYEPHVIWMLLVGMFGEWGTSIRCGWIDKPKECVEFIDAVCKMSWEAEERRGGE